MTQFLKIQTYEKMAEYERGTKVTEIREKVKDFMRQNRMDHESIDIRKECETFLQDMQKGLDGEKGCLDMLPTYIPMTDSVPSNERVIVMDAGGTNFRVATVYFDDDKNPVIEDFANYPMPGTGGEVSKEEFFQTVVEYLKPVIHKSNKIGFCFSYPTDMMSNGDGKLIRFSKEIQVKDMIGQPVGEGILEELRRQGYTEPKRIVLLNDTVSTLLGGKAAHSNMPYDSFIGYILGTGTNTCYIEQGSNIGKLQAAGQNYDTMLINMESGAYSKSPSGRIDREFDETTVNPGQANFEKKISGGYLGGLIFTLLKSAAKEGLLSETFKENINKMDTITTIDANEFLHFPYGKNLLANSCSQDPQEGQRDRTTLYYLIDSLVERAAKLVVINLTSVVIKTGKGQDPCRPVCITADGSTFYKLKNFRSKLEHYLKEYMNDELGLYCEFVEVENANLTGSAIAALAKLS
jgi:hexokinase